MYGALPPEFVEIAEVNGVRVYGGPCRDAEEPGVVLVSLNGSPRGVVEASIEDFSIEPVADLAGAFEAALRLAKRHGKIGFCCGGGCGRTSTAHALFMMASGVPLEEALGRFYERRGCGPEVVEQRFLLSVFELIRRHMGSGAVLEALDSLRRSGHFKTTYTLKDTENERVEADLTSRRGAITYRVKGTGARVDPGVRGRARRPSKEGGSEGPRRTREGGHGQDKGGRRRPQAPDSPPNRHTPIQARGQRRAIPPPTPITTPLGSA